MTVLEDDWYDGRLPPGVHLGAGSHLYGSYAFLHSRSRRPCPLRLGDDSGIYLGSMLELGPRGELQVGRFCTLGGVVVRTNGPVVIGDHALFSWDVHLVTTGTEAPVPPSDQDPDEDDPGMVLGDNVWIGAGATLLRGARVGDDAVIGARAVVRNAVPAGAVVAGNPARLVGYADGRRLP